MQKVKKNTVYIFLCDNIHKEELKMKKYNMKMPEEKEKIVKRYLNGESAKKLADEYEIDRGRIYKRV